MRPVSSLASLILTLALPISSIGQTTHNNGPRPLPQPADLKLLLQTEDGRTEYHLGEVIKLKVGYSSPSAGRYLFENHAFSYGSIRPVELQCTPSAKVIDRRIITGGVSSLQMLYSGEGCGVGFGGSSMGCGDCDSETPVTEKPDWWIQIHLNQRLQLSEPGEYSCKASASDVRLAWTSKDELTNFELNSAPLEFSIVKDAVWSKRSLDAAVLDWQRGCNEGKQDSFLHCSEDAETIRFLDTDDSMRAAAAFYPGPDGWGTKDEFFKAIMENPNRKLALELLRKRTLDPDVAVSEWLAETIVGMTIEVDSPTAFTPDSDPAVFHERAINALRVYLQDLGTSLPRKSAKGLDESRKTFERLATTRFCSEEPLFSPQELEKALISLPK